MTKYHLAWTAALLVGCSAPAESITEQPIMQNQGTELDAVALQGSQAQNTVKGFQFAGATLDGNPLTNLRIEHGELVAEQGQTTLRNTALAGAHLIAALADPAVTVEFRIAVDGIEAESESYDPTGTGDTYLYRIEQNVDGSSTWQPACGADANGRRVAIPLTGRWDNKGARIASSSLFTFGCTTGVIAKCYRWGYRPWVTGHGDLTAAHWACTRMARADYCGTGHSHTHDGTTINMWDKQSPEPINERGATPLLMLFEAGWSTSGAVCLSHARWILGGPIIALGCPNRLIAPGLGLFGATVCDTVAEALGQDNKARVFDESNLMLNLDLLGL